jgi:hypothetical protein
MVKKQKQADLPGMPKMDPLGAAATEYLGVLEDIHRLEVQRDVKKVELADQFRKSGKRSIKVSGYVFTMSEQAQLRISVKEAA